MTTSATLVSLVLILVVAMGMMLPLMTAMEQANYELPDIFYGNGHGFSKHGSQAVAIHLAMNCYGYDYKFEDPITKKEVFCIEFDGDDITIGLIVTKIQQNVRNEVTTYLRGGIKNLDDFIKLMLDRGFILKK